MSRLLRDLDYLKVIQSDNLDQIIESNQQIKLDMEQAAQTEMIGHLVQRYKTNDVFTNTTVFSNSAVYYAKNLVEFTATAFSAVTVYTTGQYVLQSGYVYKSIAGSAAHAFNSSEWTLICADKTLYYLTLPSNEWSIETTYSIGDTIWYADKEYTCLIANTAIVPSSNIAIWGTGTTYSVTGFYPDNTLYWTQGDNRNQLIVLHLLNITLYWLHMRINARNVPEHRKISYDGNGDIKNAGSALHWLHACSRGDVNADLPEDEPLQGMAIRHGNSSTSSLTGLSNNQLW